MSEPAAALDEESYEERRQRLIEGAREERQRHEAEQEAMLEAVAEGEEFDVESHTWVELGSAELQVKEWFPGDTLEDIAELAETAQSGDVAAAADSIRSTIDALTVMTDAIEAGETVVESEAQIAQFWRQYFERWGDAGVREAVEAVIGPAMEASEDAQEAVDSFPGARGGDGARRRPRRDR